MELGCDWRLRGGSDSLGLGVIQLVESTVATNRLHCGVHIHFSCEHLFTYTRSVRLAMGQQGLSETAIDRAPPSAWLPPTPPPPAPPPAQRVLRWRRAAHRAPGEGRPRGVAPAGQHWGDAPSHCGTVAGHLHSRETIFWVKGHSSGIA